MARIDIITKNKDAKAIARDLKRGVSILPFDCETDCTRNGFDYLNEKQVVWQFKVGKNIYLIDCRTVDVQIFKTALESPDIRKIIHNSAFDCSWTAREHKIFINNIGDTQLNEIMMLGVCFPRKPLEGQKKADWEAMKPDWSSALNFCLERRGMPSKFEFIPHYWFDTYIDTKKGGTVPIHDYDKKLHGAALSQPHSDLKTLEEWSTGQIKYDARDVEHLEELYEDQIDRLYANDMENLVELESRAAKVTYMMMYRGMNIDYMGWLKYSKGQEKEYLHALDVLSNFEDINWNAPGQVSKYFGVQKIAQVRELDPSKLGLEKEAAWDAWSTAQSLSKYVRTYGTTWIAKHVHMDGRVHCSYSQIINTGRYSCDSPNLQQIPAAIKTQHRYFFIAPKGKKLVVADFKSQELAIIAIGSGEDSWLECLRSGGDIHSMVASMMFIGWDEMDDKERKQKRRYAKDINFGIAYGLGAFGLAGKLFDTTNPTHEQIEFAADLLKQFRKTFKKITKWLGQNAQFCVMTGTSYSFPPFNRYRNVAALESEEWRKRNIGKNNPVQGTGADMGKLAMTYMDSAGLYIIHFNHDELIIECFDNEVDKVKEIMERCMIDACTAILDEPLTKPETFIVDTWLDAK